MKLESVKDALFREYGQIVEGYNFTELLQTLKQTTTRPLNKVIYVPSDAQLEGLSIYGALQNNYYGGMPIQIGYCNGHGTKLNALEYHRDSEINIAYDDVILLLAKQSEINTMDWSIDADRVRAFFLPAGMAVELYASTLHYAPSSADETGFQVIIVLPKGTNLAKPTITAKNGEDRLLTAANKWLIAHAEAKAEIAGGAYVGIRGSNPDARSVWK
ncbi:MAG: DUF4867 family protein [Treponema sp.]|jgi:hypothetical protein|nr:DUF4867 family protein [Treponema sp.]